MQHLFFYNELLWIFFTALASLVPFSSRGGSCGGLQISTLFQWFKVANTTFFWSIFLSHLAISVHGTAEDFPSQFCKHCGVAENARNETSSVCSCLFVWRAVWKQTDQGSKQSSRSQVPWINCYTLSVFSSCGHFLGRSVVLFLLLNALLCVFLTVAAPLWTPIAESVELSLFQWTGKELKCCYKASLDGFGATEFHTCCDFKGPCVVVGCTTSGFRFGAFNPEGYRYDVDCMGRIKESPSWILISPQPCF